MFIKFDTIWMSLSNTLRFTNRCLFVFFICISASINAQVSNKDSVSNLILENLKWVDSNYATHFDSAYAICENQIQLAKDHLLYKTEVKALITLAKISYYSGSRDKSEQLFEAALVISEEHDLDRKRLIYSLGTLKRLKGEYSSGLKHMFMALQSKGDSIFDRPIYSEIGYIFALIGLNKRAEDNLIRATKEHLNSNDLRFYYFTKSRLAEYYLRHGHENRAFLILNDVLKKRHLMHNKFEITLLYLLLAEYYININYIKEANYYVNLVDSIHKVNAVVNNIPEKNLLKSKIYVGLHEYKKAELILHKTIKSAEGISKVIIKNKAQKELALVYENLGQYREALGYSKKYINLFDSISTHLNTQNSIYLAEEFESQVKDSRLREKDLMLAKQENKLLFYLGVLIILAFSIVGLVFFYRQKRRLRQEEINQLKSKQKLIRLSAIVEGEEKEKVRLARELHDDVSGDLAAAKFNLIDLFDTLLPKVAKGDINMYLSRLDLISEKVRNISHNLVPPVIRNKSLVDAVKQMCQNRSSKHLEIHFQYFGDALRMDPIVETSIFRVVQELITNVLKHAKAKEAHVSFYFYDNYLNIIVEDDGIGLKNIEERLKLIQGDLNIDSSSSGTTLMVNVQF